MTHIVRAIFGSRWLVIAAATLTIAACDGGPATTANVGSSDPAPVTSGAPPPVTPPAGTSGTATLSWIPPDQNTDGSPLINLVGYRIYYGTAADALTDVVEIPTVGITTYVIDSLDAGTYYFSIRAYNSLGIESALSNIVSDTIS